MKYKTLLIEIIVLFMFWLVEKLWSQITRLGRSQYHHQIHHFSSWMILLFLITWWLLGSYYIAYPLCLIMIVGIGLAIWQWGWGHEFIYRRYWQKFWLYNSVIIIASFILANVFTKLPTP